MHAVIFEVIPKPGRRQDYLDTAARLKDELSRIPGFISVERFVSMNDADKLVSLSFWETEQAVKDWKNNPQHQAAQARGIKEYFKDFRIRVAHVERDYALADRLNHS